MLNQEPTSNSIELGVFVATYNKNNKNLYTSFTSNIVVGDKILCDHCDENHIDESMNNLLSSFFNRAEEIKQSVSDVKTQVIKKRVHKDSGILRELRLRVYKDSI